MAILLLILAQIAPIFLVLMMGYAAFALRWVDSAFIVSANKLVFKAALPSLLFLSVSGADFGTEFPWREIAAFSLAMLLTLAAAWGTGLSLRLPRARLASFLQGAIRGNFAIIGLAVIEQVLGEASLAWAAVLLAFFLPLHNFVSVAVLTGFSGGEEEQEHPGRHALRILYRALINPLMVAIYLGAITAVFDIPLPVMLIDALTYIKRLGLPLALVGIGGSMVAYHNGGHLPLAAGASFFKLLWMPLIAGLAGYALGLRGETLTILLVFAGGPTALVSYSLADAMGGDRDTAGSIVLVSTLFCFLSLSGIITLLRLLQLA